MGATSLLQELQRRFLLNPTFLYSKVQRDFGLVPKQLKILMLGMFVYLLAWGAFDPFISIIIYNVVGSYSLAGLLYGLFFLIGAGLAVPVGDLADKVNDMKYTILSMLTYPAIGVLYFLSASFVGVLGLALLFAARLLHGVISLFWVMVEGFIRRHSPKGETSATFGLFLTSYKLAYIVAPVISIPIILFFGLGIGEVHWLALLLIPFPLLGALIISRVFDNGEPIVSGVKEVVVKDGVFRKELQDLRKMGFSGIVCVLLGFFVKSIEAVIFFLIPLYMMSLNMGLIEMAILFSAINIPYLLSFFFAELADSLGKVNVIVFGFLAAAISLFAIASLPVSTAFYIASFGLGLVLALVLPAVNGLLTDITPRARDGEITGLFAMVFKVGGFVSAVAFGLLSDAFGLGSPFVVLAVLLILVAALVYLVKGKLVVKI